MIDDFNFKLTYSAPFGALPAHLTRWEIGNWPSILGPSHYYKQFHHKYTDPAKLDQMAKDNKLDTWVQLYNQRCGPSQWGLGYWQMPGLDERYPVPDLITLGTSKICQGKAYLCLSATPTTGRLTSQGTSFLTSTACA